MGILDSLEDSNFLSQILGIGSAQAQPAPPPPAAPPQQGLPPEAFQDRFQSAPFPPRPDYPPEQGAPALAPPVQQTPMPPPGPPRMAYAPEGQPQAPAARAIQGALRPDAGPPMGAPPPQQRPMMAPPPAAQDGGWMSTLGLDDPRNRRAALAALSSGLQNVGKTQPGGLAAFAGGMGGSLHGGRESQEQEFDKTNKLAEIAIKAKAEGDTDLYRRTTIALHREQMEQGKFTFQPGIDPETGKMGIQVGNTKTGESEFRPGSTMASRGGATAGRAGTNGWNQNRADGIAKIYGKDSPEYQQFILTGKVPNTIEMNQKALTYHKDLLSKNPELRKQFEKGEDADSWAKRKSKEMVEEWRNSIPKPPGEIKMQGNGTEVKPYAPRKPEDWSDIPEGSFFTDPNTGETRIKRKRQ